jgi:hypothetical protein
MFNFPISGWARDRQPLTRIMYYLYMDMNSPDDGESGGRLYQLD